MRNLPVIPAAMATAGCLIPTAAWAADRSPQDEARITLRQTVGCWVETDLYFYRGEGVRALVGQSPTKLPSNWAPVKTRVSLMRCLGYRNAKGESYVANLKFTPTILRGAAFRALYSQQFGTRKLPPLNAIVADPPWRIEASDGFSLLQQFGECVVAADPAAAQAILFESVASEKEQAAYAALAPALSKCVAGGSTIKFSKTLIEGVVAEGLYHLAGGDIHMRKAS